MSLKRLAKYALIGAGLEVSALPGVRRLYPSAAGRGVIFTLHHVRPQNAARYAPNAHLSVTPQFLEKAIETSLECGLTPVALEDLPRLLFDPGDKRHFVCFTLDDGYRNNAEHAAPIFRKYGVPYTIFITAGFVERSRSIWWETAEALTRNAGRLEFDFGHGIETVALDTVAQKESAFSRFTTLVQTIEEDEAVHRLDNLAKTHGIDPLAIVAELTMNAEELRRLSEDPLAHFGAHTMTHVNLRRVDGVRLRHELVASAEAVERYVGRRPSTFSYPYGYASAVGDRECDAARRAGFSVAVTTQPGMLDPSNLQRPTAFNRVSLNGRFQKKRYVKGLISGLAFKFLR
jgi:peptidoglycan/xylan/chitin deacetylase (PgdA/CDA1 family)